MVGPVRAPRSRRNGCDGFCRDGSAPPVAEPCHANAANHCEVPGCLLKECDFAADHLYDVQSDERCPDREDAAEDIRGRYRKSKTAIKNPCYHTNEGGQQFRGANGYVMHPDHSWLGLSVGLRPFGVCCGRPIAISFRIRPTVRRPMKVNRMAKL